MVGGGWCPTFLFFKSLVTNLVHSFDIYVLYVNVHKWNRCRTKVVWVLKFGEVGTQVDIIKKHQIKMIFNSLSIN